MSALAKLFKGAWGVVKKLAGLVFPMFAASRDVRSVPRLLRQVVHLALLVLIVAGLEFVNNRYELGRYLQAPLPVLREVWLPLLFLLIYSLCWLGWLLWRLLGPDQTTSDFPDIDQAWEEAMVALEQADIPLTDVPLFLVLGRPSASEKGLFNASQLTFQVRQAPRRLDAPLSVYANREGIYLTCAGASLWMQAILLSGEVSSAAEEPGVEPPAAEAAPESASVLGIDDLSPPGLLSDEDVTEPSPAQPAAASRARGGSAVLIADDEPGPSVRSILTRTALLKNADDVDRLTARLRHLCRRIAQERRPYCPLNGILLLVPFAATDSDTDTKDTASICHRDLTVVREELQVHCPVVAVVCDLERAPGFSDFLRHFPEAQRRRTLGQQFPLVPDLDAASKLRMIERGVQWIGNVLLPAMVYRLWRVGPSAGDEATDSTPANVRLYRFLAQLRERQRRIARILTRGIVLQTHGPLMLAGCYLAGTGRDAAREQGFVAGIFRQLLENQNFIAWTPDALDEESEFRRRTSFGYLALTVISATLVTIIITLGWSLLN